MRFSLSNTSKKDQNAGASTSPGTENEQAATAAPNRLELAHTLRAVIDPEVGLNIVDLGLIYDLQIEEGIATVRLTMTTPACPMSGYIKQQVGKVLQRTPGLRRGIIELVWDPPWSPLMISREAGIQRFGVRYRAV